nr:hypothetical protein ISGA_3026 [Gordonia sp. NB41Y]
MTMHHQQEMTPAFDWFPPWLTVIASILLLGAALHHLPCVLHGHGNRWFHLGHIAMCASMIYMYLIMSFRPPVSWGPDARTAQMWFFTATSAVVLAHLMVLIARRRTFSLLWVLLLVQQVAMIYMWLPMRWWSGLLTTVVSVWFLVEAIGWLADVFRGYRITPADSRTDVPDDVHMTGGWADRLTMASMAVAMAYMFVGMQAMAGFEF